MFRNGSILVSSRITAFLPRHDLLAAKLEAGRLFFGIYIYMRLLKYKRKWMAT